MRKDIRNKLEEQSKLNHDKVSKDMRAMLTVEERAKELVKRILFAYKDGQSLEHMTKVAESYLTDQKAIDIERAIKGHCRICDYYSCCPFQFEGCYERGEIFKAMEE